MTETNKKRKIEEGMRTKENVKIEITALEKQLKELKVELKMIEEKEWQIKLDMIKDPIERAIESESASAFVYLKNSVMPHGVTARYFTYDYDLYLYIKDNYNQAYSRFSEKGLILMRGSTFSGDQDDYNDFCLVL